MSTDQFEGLVSRGKLLDLDLTTGQHKELVITMAESRKWLGGVSLALKLLYDRVPAGLDPFDPQNLFIAMTGPLTGTLCPGNRQVIVHKSPHTGLENNSYIGGGIGSAIKRAGYDGIVISGASEKPVWIEITDHATTIHDASKYWGKDAFYTEEKLKKQVKRPNSKVLTIGQAGENLVTYACVNTDYYAQARLALQLARLHCRRRSQNPWPVLRWRPFPMQLSGPFLSVA